MTDENLLPSQIAARREIEEIYAKAGAQKENPPTWEHEATLRRLDELRPKAFPDPTAPTGSTRPAAVPAPVLIRPGSDFSVPSEATPSPVSPMDIIARIPGDVFYKYMLRVVRAGSLDPEHIRMRQAFHTREDRARRGTY